MGENYLKMILKLWKNGLLNATEKNMLHAHLDSFKENMGAYSEEQGERFHQDINSFEC